MLWRIIAGIPKAAHFVSILKLALVLSAVVWYRTYCIDCM